MYDIRRREEVRLPAGESGVEEMRIAPEFQQKPADLEVPEGSTARFDCTAIGKPAPEIHWLHNEKPIGQDATHKVHTLRVVYSDTRLYTQFLLFLLYICIYFTCTYSIC